MPSIPVTSAYVIQHDHAIAAVLTPSLIEDADHHETPGKRQSGRAGRPASSPNIRHRAGVGIAPVDRQAWLTPKSFIDKVLAALDISAFSIDVASNGAGTSNVPALAYYTKDDPRGCGLTRPWRGAVVWCNPPYGSTRLWTEKALNSVVGGEAGLVVMLVPASVDTAWYHDHVADRAHVLFLRGRLRFWATPEVCGGPANFPCMLIAWGGTREQIQALAAAFPTAKHQAPPGWHADETATRPAPVAAAPVVDAATATIELFAGGGSVHLAMREAGYTTVFANDWCDHKRASYATNFPHVPLDGRDIRALRGHDLPEAAILTASSPCQDHSSNGRRVGFSGERGRLALEVIRLLGEMRALGRAPKVLVFENVIGMLTQGGGRDFAALAQALASEGYLVGGLVMDALDFVPQSRRRVFLVGVRNDVEVPRGLVAGRPTRAWHPQPLRDAHAALSMAGRQAWRWWTLPRPPRRTTRLSDVLDQGADRWLSEVRLDHLAPRLTDADHARLAQARADGVLVGVVSGKRRVSYGALRRVLEARFDGHVRCLLTEEGGDDAQRLAFPDGTERGFRLRDFTPRERARLTGLPDDYILPNAAQTTRLTGDAIVVPCYAWLARHLLHPLAQAPQAKAAEVSAVARTKKPLDEAGRVVSGRHGIKGSTVGQTNYFLPSTHERLLVSAAAEGVSMTEFLLRLADRHFAGRGELPLERYVRAPRRGQGGRRAKRGGDITTHRPLSRSLRMRSHFRRCFHPRASLGQPTRSASPTTRESSGGAARSVTQVGSPSLFVVSGMPARGAT